MQLTFKIGSSELLLTQLEAGRVLTSLCIFVASSTRRRGMNVIHDSVHLSGGTNGGRELITSRSDIGVESEEVKIFEVVLLY